MNACHKSICWAVFALAICAGMLHAETVYTADESGMTLSAVNTEKHTASRLAVTAMPHNLDLTPDGKTLLVTGMAHENGAGKLLIFDVTGAEPKLLREIPLGKHLAHVVPAHDGHTAYVTDSEADSVLVVDYQVGKLLKTVKAGAYPHGLRLSPDGKWLAVANMKDGSVSILDAVAGTEKTKIVAGKKPVQVAFSPDGTKVAVSLFDEDRIAVLDVAKGERVKKYEVGHGPVQLGYAPDGSMIVVANQGTKEKPDNRMSIIHLKEGEAEFVTTGAGAHGVAFSKNGQQAYITNSMADSLSLVGLKTPHAVKTVTVGKGPNGVASR